MTAGPRIVVTGGAGFIGRALCARLAGRGLRVTALLRREAEVAPGIEARVMGTLTAETDWAPLLAGAAAVVHLASRAHAPAGAAEGRDWIAAEAASAGHLAEAAVDAGVERIVLLSSVKVHGEITGATAFRADMAPAPADPYARAKWGIEQAMRRATLDRPRLIVLRPPLVYGPGVKANFLALLRLVDRGLPLPFASIANRRSLIFLGNLIDLIETVLAHPAAPDGTFLLRDDEELSTPDLARRIARALDRPSRLLPCPPPLLHAAARLVGRGAAAERLLGSLRVDDGATRTALGWRPSIALDAGLAKTCRWLRRNDDSQRGHSPL